MSESEKEISYEEALARLETIVAEMERADAPLDELLKLYEEGARLAFFCSETLDEAQKKVVSIEERYSGEAQG